MQLKPILGTDTNDRSWSWCNDNCSLINFLSADDLVRITFQKFLIIFKLPSYWLAWSYIALHSGLYTISCSTLLVGFVKLCTHILLWIQSFFCHWIALSKTASIPVGIKSRFCTMAAVIRIYFVCKLFVLEIFM